ncbi:hypothetical protein EV360DRAFT_51853 [Lentinula raphanica]|nr:hypothetical protein EV360DRAFT_51853 [Lentinula raphanica]
MSQDLAQELAWMHSHLIAHMDINPHNLVFDPSFRLLIIDFDNAVRLQDVDECISGQIGTEYWMASGMVLVIM